MTKAGPDDNAAIPEEIRSLFWDTDLDEDVIARSPTYVIERVLEEGPPAAIRWFRRRYGDAMIGEVVRKAAGLAAAPLTIGGSSSRSRERRSHV